MMVMLTVVVMVSGGGGVTQQTSETHTPKLNLGRIVGRAVSSSLISSGGTGEPGTGVRTIWGG